MRMPLLAKPSLSFTEEIPVSIFAEARKEENGFVMSYFFAFVDMSGVEKRSRELQGKIEELEKFRKIVIARELKMVELKNEIKRLRTTTNN